MGLFNPFARPVPAFARVEPPLAKPSGKEQAGPLATSFARNPRGGHPAAGLTPEALAVILRSSIDGSPRRYLELAEDMEERFIQYSSVLSSRKRAVRRLEISVKAAGNDAADLAEAELVRQVVGSAAFRTVLIHLLDAIGKSYSAVEMIWDTRTKPWKPVKFKHRDPRFFEAPEADPEHLMLLNDHGREDLWPNTWIVHKAKAKSGLTIRGGLARPATWLYLFQAFNIKDWAIFAEAYGQPLRVGKFNPGASDTDKAVLLEAVHNIGADYAAIIPQAMAIEFVKAEIAGSTDLYERRADWLDRQCSKLVLGQTGTTDSQSGSGYAQAKVHDDVREDIVDSDAEELAATLNEQLVPPLIGFNFSRSRKGLPEIVIGRPEEEDVDTMVKVAKAFGLRVKKDEAYGLSGFSIPEETDEVIDLSAGRNAPTPDGADDLPLPERPGKPTKAAVEAGQDAIAAAVEDLLAAEGWQPLVAPVVKGLAEEIAEATSVDEVKRILQRRAATLSVGELTDALARLSFGARLAGEVDEELRDGR
jgi:phage gp29-like protein